jgi:hypothetical protein
VTAAAELLNHFIMNLGKACSSPAPSAESPYLDPYTILQNAKHQLLTFVQAENCYKQRCLTEQNVEKALENEVFIVLQHIPPEQAAIIMELLDRSNKELANVEAALDFDTSQDWTVFESVMGDKFVPFNPPIIALTPDNHPGDEQFSQFEEFREDALQIKHKLPRKPSKDSLRDFVGKVIPRQKRYSVRGEWFVSSGGWFIEWTANETIRSMFNLRNCKLGPCAPDQYQVKGHFTLQGQKVYQRPGKKTIRRKRDYQFRAPLVKAQRLHEALSQFCEGGERETELDDNSSSTSGMSGTTTICG